MMIVFSHPLFITLNITVIMNRYTTPTNNKQQYIFKELSENIFSHNSDYNTLSRTLALARSSGIDCGMIRLLIRRLTLSPRFIR